MSKAFEDRVKQQIALNNNLIDAFKLNLSLRLGNAQKLLLADSTLSEDGNVMHQLKRCVEIVRKVENCDSHNRFLQNFLDDLETDKQENSDAITNSQQRENS